MSVTIINVSGNIGSGKSTLLKNLRFENFMVVREPVHLFKNYKGVNLLEGFYNKTISSIDFQTTMGKIFIDYHIKKYNKCIKNNIKYMITERSVIDSIEIFSRILIKDEAFYESIYHEVKEYQKYLPSLFIYIKSDPSNCLNRIILRNRKEERGIQLEYLEQLHDATERFFESLPVEKKLVYCMETKSKTMVADDVSSLLMKYI